jgi:hypothetical protein
MALNHLGHGGLHHQGLTLLVDCRGRERLGEALETGFLEQEVEAILDLVGLEADLEFALGIGGQGLVKRRELFGGDGDEYIGDRVVVRIGYVAAE